MTAHGPGQDVVGWPPPKARAEFRAAADWYRARSEMADAFHAIIDGQVGLSPTQQKTLDRLLALWPSSDLFVAIASRSVGDLTRIFMAAVDEVRRDMQIIQAAAAQAE